MGTVNAVHLCASKSDRILSVRRLALLPTPRDGKVAAANLLLYWLTPPAIFTHKTESHCDSVTNIFGMQQVTLLASLQRHLQLANSLTQLSCFPLHIRELVLACWGIVSAFDDACSFCDLRSIKHVSCMQRTACLQIASCISGCHYCSVKFEITFSHFGWCNTLSASFTKGS